MNRKHKKLKQTKHIIKLRKSNPLKRPQFTKHPIQRKKRIRRLRHPAGPFGTMIKVDLATVRTFNQTGISELKKTREKNEETRSSLEW